MSERIIAAHPPNDGREWDNQCARCGSSVTRIVCDQCDGDGAYTIDEDACRDYLFDCDSCDGMGGWFQCGSSQDWCEANPMHGREQTKRGELEWFTFDMALGSQR